MDDKFTIKEKDAGVRLDRFLARELPGKPSRTEVQRRVEAEGISLNGIKTFETKTLLKTDDRIDVPWEPMPAFKLTAENIPLEIVYEDGDILVVNKPAGMVVHPAPGSRAGTLVHALLGLGRQLSVAGGKERPGIVHRIDKDTSGLLVIAKNAKVHRAFARMFQDRAVVKVYDCIAEGRIAFEEGQIDRPIGRDTKNRFKMAVRPDEKGKEALTTYKVKERFVRSTYLKVRILTGRTHQIRVHFKEIGHPVLGDPLYGRKREFRIALHAGLLEFDHPLSGKRIRCEANIPEDFRQTLEAERKTRR